MAVSRKKHKMGFFAYFENGGKFTDVRFYAQVLWVAMWMMFVLIQVIMAVPFKVSELLRKLGLGRKKNT